MTIEEIYEQRKDDPRWNTSYPLSPNDWSVFRVPGSLPFTNEKDLSFYIHIPFCRHLCAFCEYTRMRCPDVELQKKYVQAVGNDIKAFRTNNNGFKLHGFDIGGGTPTALSEKNFSFLMDIYDTAISGLSLSEDFEPSIEGTFATLTNGKLKRIVASGIRRLSLGVQSSCDSLMRHNNRNNVSEKGMEEWLDKAWHAGIEKINLDFMYGLNGQTKDTIDRDIEIISHLQPQQVTLYELRTNMISAKYIPNKDELFTLYSHYYDGLIGLGYYALFGQNTFSKDSKDLGVSSYLRERMINGMSYKGFGLSAQSMSKTGVSYNIGKGDSLLTKYLSNESFPEGYTYQLPPEELASKYMAISAYNGSFSLSRLKEFGINEERVKATLDFCVSEGLIEKGVGDRYNITKNGFKCYGAVFSLFYAQQ